MKEHILKDDLRLRAGALLRIEWDKPRIEGEIAVEGRHCVTAGRPAHRCVAGWRISNASRICLLEDPDAEAAAALWTALSNTDDDAQRERSILAALRTAGWELVKVAGK